MNFLIQLHAIFLTFSEQTHCTLATKVDSTNVFFQETWKSVSGYGRFINSLSITL